VQALALKACEVERHVGTPTCPASQRPESNRSRLSPAEFESVRAALMRFAKRALRNAADAEDVVQETLEAAIASPDAFGGRSSRMTWLLAILKHKVVDVYRRQARETPLDEALDIDGLDDSDALFTPDGHWRESPASWGNPEAALSQSEFLQVLEGCIACLPARMARAFTMREVLELEVGEICAALGISENHCFVMLHRARMRLRLLLEQHWFGMPAAQRG
jgi:RNA polymerase sigma-70 factor (TIGR02943 family)